MIATTALIRKHNMKYRDTRSSCCCLFPTFCADSPLYLIKCNETTITRHQIMINQTVRLRTNECHTAFSFVSPCSFASCVSLFFVYCGLSGRYTFLIIIVTVAAVVFILRCRLHEIKKNLKFLFCNKWNKHSDQLGKQNGRHLILFCLSAYMFSLLLFRSWYIHYYYMYSFCLVSVITLSWG